MLNSHTFRRSRPIFNNLARFYATSLKNSLKNASSPYLRSHAENPVAWQEWTDATLKLAAQEDKPVFLSIGYHTCHWCHVMNKESFADSTIAELLNEHFIPIKVDKEERPDIDAVYMMYLQSCTGQGGWPLNVFLVPDTLEPIYGGTYWAGPGVSGRNAMFEDVLKAVSDVWKRDKEKCRVGAEGMADRLRGLVKAQSEAESAEFSIGVFEDVNEHFSNTFDDANGGFTQAPKFAMPHNLSFLIRFRKWLTAQEKVPTNAQTVSDKAAYTLWKIGRGGIKDQIGHGFSRYSVTEDWNLPHFEKMLYDQALLLNAYTDAYEMGESWAKEYMEDIIHFLLNGSLTNAKGGFYSAQDADSLDSSGHYREGAYYVWTDREFYDAIGKRMDADIAAMYWNVHEHGNVDPQFDLQNELQYQNVLSIAHKPEDIGQTFGVSPEQVKRVVQESKAKLIKYREQDRQPPPIDHKIVACWNGLAIGALARAGRVLARDDAVQAACNAAKFIKKQLYDTSTRTLRRVNGSKTNGMNEDYSYMISGLMDLYESNYDWEWLDWARDLQETQLRLFWDHANGGFYSTEEETATELIFRPKTGFDGAEPSSNGVAVMNLYKLSTMLNINEFEMRAVETLNCYGKDLVAQPFGYLTMLGGVAARLKGLTHVIIVGEGSTSEIVQKVKKDDPLAVVVRLTPQSVNFFVRAGETNVYGDLFDKHGKGGIKAFVCKNRSCTPLSV